jgi:hypothetical protein
MTSSSTATIHYLAFDNTPSLNCLHIPNTVFYAGSALICPPSPPTESPTASPTAAPSPAPPAEETASSNDKLPKDSVAVITVGTVLAVSVIAAVAYVQFTASTAAVVSASQPASTSVAKQAVELVANAEEA